MSADAQPPVNPEDTLRKMAEFLEKTRLAAFVDLMAQPRRLMWLNFIGGIARGVGQFIGFALLGGLFLIGLANLLKHYFHHMGGVPFGNELDELIGWILQVVDAHKANRQ